jgi:hypothetical protein
VWIGVGIDRFLGNSIPQPFASQLFILTATYSGERGIRTLGEVAPTSVFETDPIGRSGISPVMLSLTVDLLCHIHLSFKIRGCPA